MPDREDDMSIAPLAERPSAEAPSAEADETGSPELEPLPSWVFPPEEGFSAEDLDRLRGIPPHTELVDGTLIFVSPQTNFHMSTLFLLESELRRAVPADLRVRREMTMTLGKRQRPEPDLLVVHAEAVKDLKQTTYQPADVVLAVEVVSAESEIRDRERKPVLYAQAGIDHFWRIEEKDGRPVVYVYELDPATKAYALMGIHHDRLKINVPFDVDVDLTEIDDL
ncbi:MULTISPECIES: Uma2 family endonuclease [unclassified Streptosporangium]|uniref:Uma2 family endonuclease n=1 Tax=unclassified Streptosporangium TaxID=2632669 RepID=UPI002E2CFEA9|nr:MULTISPECIES: Uma2 family endonuclease [unclassified Streptosporangium]